MYANIIVDISHEKVDKTFQYKIPDELNGIMPGAPVIIPFGAGNREIKGFVIETTDICEYDESKIKSILRIDNKSVEIEGKLINLAWFIKNTYGSTMNQALKTVLPVKKKTREIVNRTLILSAKDEEVTELIEKYTKKHAVARLRLLNELMRSHSLPESLVTGKMKVSREVIKSFLDMGIIEIKSETSYRNPVNINDLTPYDIQLTSQQRQIADSIVDSHELVHLIHGVTGSGKTEVYMDVIERTILGGKQVIVLIPEIALTYQTVMRFYRKFGDRVSIINSKLSQGERFDQFTRAKNGEIDIMIGPRSAVFTPFDRLGLIVIDEEHETSYKSENVPKYHARETAIYRASREGAKVILGSATPSIESYHKALDGKYQLYKLNERANSNKMANVEVVDLREELKEGNKSMISRKLDSLIRDRLEKKEQVMLFINRRGYAGFVSCRSCGEPIKCPHCDVSLNLHNGNRMICHYCGYEIPLPKLCPKCDSKYIAAFGTGTQKVEKAVLKLYPTARTLRMDLDTTRNKGDHEKILEAFSNREADILVGTQMIVKGHDFPNVTLVGVIAADLSLFAADYRAGERTFDLLTQAAGRAGRGSKEGKVVIQTYKPEEYSIVAAAKQDYELFYKQEILYRKLSGYPPMINMMAVLVNSEFEEVAQEAASLIKTTLESNKENLMIIGPADCSISKINDVYRKVIYFKHKEQNTITKYKDILEQEIEKYDKSKDVLVQFDLNPLTFY